MPATPSHLRRTVLTVFVLGALLAAAHWREAISATFPTAFQVLYTAPFAGTSPATRTQHAKNSDLVSVKEFGALGNGSTNDEAAFALARTAAGAGGTVIVPCPGTYVTTTWGTLPCGVALNGPAVAGTLPQANGGTGAGALNCAGQALTSNGTAYSCTAGVAIPPFIPGGTRRATFATIQDLGVTSFATYGLPSLTLGVNNGTTVNSTDAPTHAMLKFTVPGTAANKAGFVAQNVARVAYLPRLDINVYAGPTTTSAGGTLDFVVGLVSDINPLNILGQTGGVCGTSVATGATGAFICYENATGLAPGNGLRWVYCFANATTISCTDSGITVATGFHTFIIDMSVAGATTYQIDGNTPVTRNTTSILTTTQLGVEFGIINFGTSSGYNASTTGFQLTQNF